MKLYHTIFYYATDFIAVMQENPLQRSTFFIQTGSPLTRSAARCICMAFPPHILYKANDHIMMSSRNLSVPDFYEFRKDSRSTSFKKGVFSCRQTRYGAWYAPDRNLYPLRNSSGVLSFALFKFRLPENQVNLAVCAVYILSCFFGGMIAGKTRGPGAFSGAWSSEAYIFCFYTSCPSPRRTVSRKIPKDFSLSSPCAH